MSGWEGRLRWIAVVEPASATNVASQAKLGFDELAANLQDRDRKSVV